MIVLGMDQSFTCSGIVISDERVVIDHHRIFTDKESTLTQRIKMIWSELEEYIIKYKPDVFSIESLSYGSVGNATRNLAGLFHVILFKLEECYPHIKIITIPPPTLKKYATGSGKAKKDEVFESMPPEVQSQFIDYPKSKGRYDLSDSYWLSIYGFDKQ